MKTLMQMFKHLSRLLMIMILASCTAEDIKNAIDQIKTDEQGKVPGLVGSYALDDGSGFTSTYISFDNDTMYEYKADESKVIAQGYLWNTTINDFTSTNSGKYSVSSDILYCNGFPYGKIQILNDRIVLDGKTYTKFIGTKQERYSTISVDGELSQILSYTGHTLIFPVSVDRTIPSGKLTVSNIYTWISTAEISNGVLTLVIEENNVLYTRSASIILRYADAVDVVIQIQQYFSSSSLSTTPYSQDVDYRGGNFSMTYTVANPRETATVAAISLSNWITDVKVEGNIVSYRVVENNSGSSRSGTISLSYGSYTSRSFSVYQSYTAPSINLTTESKTVEYSSGSYSFDYTIVNPRSGINCTATSQNDWISEVKVDGNSVSYKVAENNSGASRSGKIKLNYGGLANREFPITQNYTKSSITLMPTSQTADYKGGNYSISISISAPREGTSCIAVSQNDWITNVQINENTITYKIEENNTDALRQGNIRLTYSKFATANYAITQSRGPQNADLSRYGSANCYIVYDSGQYHFAAVKGNSTTSLGNISKVEVLWESFGTDTTPMVGSIINNVSFASNKVTFSTPTILNNGNAVIAAKDASDNILWSWHIWVCKDYDFLTTAQTYYNSAGLMMDRNLGATSATPGNVGALGLMYQWGRKDPFLGSSSISSSITAKSTIEWPSSISTTDVHGTEEYAASHPTTFIGGVDETNYDWMYTSENNLWGAVKTIYDPCPSGWKVPEGGSNGVWSKATSVTSGSFSYTLDSTKKGMNYNGKLGSASTIWYPSSGWRNHIDGSLGDVDNGGKWWTCTTDNHNAYRFYFNGNARVYPAGSGYRAGGFPVRCIKEQ